MNGKELLLALSYVEEKFVDEAENESIKKPGRAKASRWIALAACLCIVVGAAFAWMSYPIRLGEHAVETADPVGAAGVPEQEIEEELSTALPQEEAAEEGSVTAPYIRLQIQERTPEGVTGIVTEVYGTEAFQEGDRLSLIQAVAEESKSVCEDAADREAALRIVRDGEELSLEVLSWEEEDGWLYVEFSDPNEKG